MHARQYGGFVHSSPRNGSRSILLDVRKSTKCLSRRCQSRFPWGCRRCPIAVGVNAKAFRKNRFAQELPSRWRGEDQRALCKSTGENRFLAICLHTGSVSLVDFPWSSEARRIQLSFLEIAWNCIGGFTTDSAIQRRFRPSGEISCFSGCWIFAVRTGNVLRKFGVDSLFGLEMLFFFFFRSYVVSFIIQFQFHKGACIKAGEYETGNPRKLLSDCDIYQSAAAGNALK